jgi:hypothetical protein
MPRERSLSPASSLAIAAEPVPPPVLPLVLPPVGADVAMASGEPGGSGGGGGAAGGGANGAAAAKPQEKVALHIKNLALRTTEKELYEYFSTLANVRVGRGATLVGTPA